MGEIKMGEFELPPDRPIVIQEVAPEQGSWVAGGVRPAVELPPAKPLRPARPARPAHPARPKQPHSVSPEPPDLRVKMGAVMLKEEKE
jgi:hypothetical protein